LYTFLNSPTYNGPVHLTLPYLFILMMCHDIQIMKLLFMWFCLTFLLLGPSRISTRSKR
jgi:hypothetical protein